MTRLYLHIGTPKSGSTTIQSFLSANEAALPFRSVKAFGGLTATKLRYSIDNARSRASYANSWRYAKLPRFEDITKGIWEAAQAEVSAASDDHRPYLISGEQFYWFFDKDSDAINSLQASLAGLFDEITVLLYLRPQVGFVKSLYSQQVKGQNRSTVSYKDFVSDRDGLADLCDYSGRTDLWAEAFGSKNLRVIPVHPDNYANGNLVVDFLIRVDAEDPSLLGMAQEHPRSNVSPTFFQLNLIRRGNQLGLDRKFLRRWLISDLTRKLGAEKFPDTYDNQIRDVSRDGNRKLNASYLRDFPVKLPE